MSTTDELRTMLDERGVKYRTHGTTDRTWFEVSNISWFIIERENGSLTADAVFLTPEQAIAATLGRGECHDIGYRMDSTRFKCSQCGWDGWVRHAKDGRDYKPLWCPLCGARVMEVDE